MRTNLELDTHVSLILPLRGQRNRGASSSALVEFVGIGFSREDQAHPGGGAIGLAGCG